MVESKAKAKAKANGNSKAAPTKKAVAPRKKKVISDSEEEDEEEEMSEDSYAEENSGSDSDYDLDRAVAPVLKMKTTATTTATSVPTKGIKRAQKSSAVPLPLSESYQSSMSSPVGKKGKGGEDDNSPSEAFSPGIPTPKPVKKARGPAKPKVGGVERAIIAYTFVRLCV